MPTEWNTVNIKPGKGGILREIEILRKQYSDHRTTLERLALDAPTEHLAARYRELIAELEASMAKIEDLEMGGASRDEPWSETMPHGDTAPPAAPLPRRTDAGRRTLLILLAGLFMLSVFALLLWNWLADQPAAAPDPEPPPAAAVTPSFPEPVVEQPAPRITIRPESQSYGRIPRGARAARQFEIANDSEATLPIEVRRSDCRCLWFEYADTIPPRGTTTLTVTVDGAKAPPGELHETVTVESTSTPRASATFEVHARID